MLGVSISLLILGLGVVGLYAKDSQFKFWSDSQRQAKVVRAMLKNKKKILAINVDQVS